MNYFQSLIPINSVPTTRTYSDVVKNKSVSPIDVGNLSYESLSSIPPLLPVKRSAPPTKIPQNSHNNENVTSSDIDRNKSTKRQKTENKIKDEIIKRGLNYEYPSAGEDDKRRDNRIKRMRYALQKHEKELNSDHLQSAQPVSDNKLARCQKIEDELKEKLVKHNLVYEPPPTGEDDKGRNARLRRMRRAFNKYEKD